MTVVPDTKSWVWVLDRRCAECGFDTRAVSIPDIAALTRATAAQFAVALGAPDVARRFRPDRWSPLEYAAHVRDVYRIFDHRLGRVLYEDNPLFANWDQDRTAIEARYAELDPAAVATEIRSAAAALADRIDRLPGSVMGRTGRRSDGASFTVQTLLRYYIHDPVHHLVDIGQPAPVEP